MKPHKIPTNSPGTKGMKQLDLIICTLDITQVQREDFLKPDSIVPNPANPQSWNLYTYVKGSPVNFNDPGGHALNPPILLMLHICRGHILSGYLVLISLVVAGSLGQGKL
jgi:hypothetical protein